MVNPPHPLLAAGPTRLEVPRPPSFMIAFQINAHCVCIGLEKHG